MRAYNFTKLLQFGNIYLEVKKVKKNTKFV